MAIVVIGGQTRNIGKTSVVCGLISALPERRWTAIKVTQCKHADGDACDCELSGGEVAITEEHDASAGTDSSRYLAAGAVRSLWVRTRPGQLAAAMPRIRAAIGSGENAILESNSVLEYLKPDLYAMVLDPGLADFKASARRVLDRADAMLICGAQGQVLGVSAELRQRIRTFRIEPPSYYPAEFVSFVAHMLDGA